MSVTKTDWDANASAIPGHPQDLITVVRAPEGKTMSSCPGFIIPESTCPAYPRKSWIGDEAPFARGPADQQNYGRLLHSPIPATEKRRPGIPWHSSASLNHIISGQRTYGD